MRSVTSAPEQSHRQVSFYDTKKDRALKVTRDILWKEATTLLDSYIQYASALSTYLGERYSTPEDAYIADLNTCSDVDEEINVLEGEIRRLGERSAAANSALYKYTDVSEGLSLRQPSSRRIGLESFVRYPSLNRGYQLTPQEREEALAAARALRIEMEIEMDKRNRRRSYMR